MQGAQQCAYFAWADALPNKALTPGQQRAAPGTGVYGTPRQASAAEGRFGQPGPTQSAPAHPVGEAGSWESAPPPQGIGKGQVAPSEGEAQDSRLWALHVRFGELQAWPNQAAHFTVRLCTLGSAQCTACGRRSCHSPPGWGPARHFPPKVWACIPGSVSLSCMLAAGGVSLSPGQQAAPGSVPPGRGCGLQAGEAQDMSSCASDIMSSTRSSLQPPQLRLCYLLADAWRARQSACFSSSAAASAAARLASS